MIVKIRRTKLFVYSLITTLILILILIYQNKNISEPVAIVGDASILKQNYENWKQAVNQQGEKITSLSLVSPNAHSSNHTDPHGSIQLNFETMKVTAKVYNLPTEKKFELWATTNNARLYSKNTNNASLQRIGRFHVENNYAILEESIAHLQQEKFEIEQMVISPTNTNPLESGILAASPNLFQRLYAAEQKVTEDIRMPAIIGIAHANVPTGFPDVFSDLVTQGEDLFFNGTFDGNGRSCGTCHPAENNFTIDLNFISSLPQNDPLFVAETVPALIFGDLANLDSGGRPQRFENPALMRTFGLIVENLDGMGDLENRFNMRSVPHNIGMTVSITTPPNDLRPPDDRTGWSGDGAPSGIVGGIAASGRLRDFILGAIVQHYPLTMARDFNGLNPDFRAPTANELDALEAFMFSVGRQQELDLTTLVLKDANAEAGKLLFRGNGAFTCNNCHNNAGANILAGANPGNRNFNTGVELFLRNRITDSDFTVVGEPRPVDGGFGTNPAGNFTSLVPQSGFSNENFGNQAFNTTSLVEAADTAPFFHNNIIDNLEDTVRFYNSPEFVSSFGRGIAFNETEVTQVANFLRVINAIDNIDNAALRSAARAIMALNQDPNSDDVIHRILQLAIADTQDAIQVLTEGNLHNQGGLLVNVVKKLEKAKQGLQQAMNVSASDVARKININQAQMHMNNAIALMRF